MIEPLVSVVGLVSKCLNFWGRSKAEKTPGREEKRIEERKEKVKEKAPNTQNLPEDNSQSPHPRRLYELEVVENTEISGDKEAAKGLGTAGVVQYKVSIGGFCGIANGLLFVWKLVIEPESDSKKLSNTFVKIVKQVPRWSGISSADKVLGFIGFWMIGYDKSHAHPTAVFCVSDDNLRVEINSDLQSLHAQFEKLEYLGYLVLKTRPSFLSDYYLTRSSQSSAERRDQIASEEYRRRSIFLKTNQPNRAPPCEIEFFDSSRKRWQKSTIGGTFWDGKQSFGVVITGHTLRTTEEDPDIIQIASSSSHVPHSSPPSAPSSFALTSTSPKAASVSSLGPVGEHFGTIEVEGPLWVNADWALVSLVSNPRENIIQIPNSFGEALVVNRHADKIVGGPIYIVTGRVTRSRGVLTGSLIISGESMEKKYRIHADLEQYDCGSWVIDVETGSFLGIVRDISEFGDGWLLPAKTVFQVISDKGKKLSLPDWDSSRARAYKDLSLEYEERSRSPPTKKPQGRWEMDSIFGPPFGKLGEDTLWEIAGTYESHWNALRPQIEDILRRTPSLSQNETAPLVLLQGFMAGSEISAALPIVVISCSSATYATQLQKAIRRNGVSERYNFRLKVVKYPVQRQAGSRAPLQTV